MDGLLIKIERLLPSGNYILHRLATVNFHASYLIIVFLIFAIVVLSYLVNIFLSKSFLGNYWRIFVAPGIIIHELSHALLCLLTGAKIKKISLFDKEGGSVEHEPSKLPLLGPILISLSPFFAGVMIIFFTARWLGLKDIDYLDIKLDFNFLMSFSMELWRSMNLSSWLNWLLLYLAISVAVTMTPSKQDIKNITLALLIILCMTVLLYLLKVNLSLHFLPIEQLTWLLATVIILLILGTLLSMILFVATKLFKR